MQYIITGQKPLSGSVAISGAKNAALKLIIGSLLTQGVSVIRNVPQIRDVYSLLEIINYLGGRAEFTAKNTVEVENKLDKFKIPLEIAGKTRVSIMLLAPLLHQFGKAVLPNPGGCRLGERSVDRLIASVKKMGGEIEYDSRDGYYYCSLDQAKSAKVSFSKKSHTGTELALMFASRISGKTLIENAAQEPEINDLIQYFNQAGARISRKQDDIEIIGKHKLKATQISVQSDRIETVTFIVLSALFGGRVKIRNVNLGGIEPFLKFFVEAGFNYQYDISKQLFKVVTTQTIKPTHVNTAPHPGFLTDWQPLWTILMTQATGLSTVHETVFENRLSYIHDLVRFGAKINFYKPEVKTPQLVYQFNNYNSRCHTHQAIKISGPTKLHNCYSTMTDIRAGASLLIASLIARGRSVISGAEQIERGYENMVGKLLKLGAQIRIRSEN